MKPIQSYVITRPTSAYRVINRVKKLVAEEPKRMRMKTWLLAGHENLLRELGTERLIPACSTVGCMAGWGVFVVKQTLSVPYRKIADVLCGVGSTASRELSGAFNGGDHFYLQDGTQEQADAVCDFLTKFQERHKALLKSRIVYPGGEVKVKSERSTTNRAPAEGR